MKDEKRLEKLTKRDWRIMRILIIAMIGWESTEKVTSKELIELVKALGKVI